MRLTQILGNSSNRRERRDSLDVQILVKLVMPNRYRYYRRMLQ